MYLKDMLILKGIHLLYQEDIAVGFPLSSTTPSLPPNKTSSCSSWKETKYLTLIMIIIVQIKYEMIV